MIMKCKYEHDGDCCYSCADQYMCKCKQPCEFICPLTNGDRIRSMSDEKLAAWLVKKTKYQESAWSQPSYLNFLTESDDTMESAIKGTVEWLKQPVDGGADNEK